MNLVPLFPSSQALAAVVPVRGPRVVLLDDDPVMLRALERLLARAGFSVIATHDPRRALEVVVCEGADAIVSDLYMPGIGGNVVLAMLAKAAPRTARLLLTSETDFHAVATLSLPFSVDAFLPKRDVSQALVPTLRLLLGERVKEDTCDKPGARDETREFAHSVARSLMHPDAYTHSRRVAAWSTHLGARVGLSPTELLDLELGALLHDVGEAGLRQGLLDAPRRLAAAELAEMRQHPDIGAALLANVFMLRRAIPVVQTHHEHFDGTGYPRGLRGNAIPLESRVFHIVDAYDGIRSDRPHRRGRGDLEARVELECHAGLQFDPDIHDAFSRIDPEEWTSVVARIFPG